VSLFDALFVAVALAVVVTIATAAASAVRGRWRRAAALLGACAAGTAIYLGVVVAVSLASPQRVLAIGDDWCFDDWCVTVDEVRRTSVLGPRDRPATADGTFWVVRLHLSNHGRGRAQRASSAAIHLLDARGRRHAVSLRGQQALEADEGPAPPLTATVSVGTPVNTVQVFDVPSDARIRGLTVRHPVGPAPGLFIVGDPASLLHRPTIVRLD